MKLLLFLVTFLVAFTLWGTKPLPPGAGASIKPNVLFVVDNSGSMGAGRPSRMAQSKAALHLLLSDSNITNSIRLGLSQFPNRSWGCGSDKRQLLAPIREATSAHITRVRSQVNGLRANGGTPLGNALRHSGYYLKGQAGSYGLSFYPSAEANSPVIHRCQRNYVIIFTDGGECCHCSSWSSTARTEASALFNTGLSGFTINGNNLEYPEVPVYAIGFHGVNVNYIAAAGGTGTGYNANDQAGLLTAFQQIVRDIGAKNITATSPTLIPAFTGPNADVIYMSKFVPREDKEWKGHLYKYKLDSTTDILGALQWDLHEQLVTAGSSSRDIRTVCKNNARRVDEFKLSNADVLASCMVVNSGNGAGDPVEVCNITPGTWEDRVNSCQGWSNVFGESNKCNPEREVLEPICIGNDTLVDRVRANAALMNVTCLKHDINTYSGGTCNGDNLHDAELVKRYMCQKLETYCGCYKSFSVDRNRARSCSNDSHCGGAPNSCSEGYCVGEAISLNDPSIWDPQNSVKYANNISSDVITFSAPDARDYNRVEISLENLKFHQAGNASNRLRDYLVIEELAHTGDASNDSNPSTDAKYNVITKLANRLTLFKCTVIPIGIGSDNLDVRGCNAENLSGTSLTRIFETHALKLTFHSNANANAEALKVLRAFRVRHTDVKSCHWEPGGNGGVTRAEMEMKEVRRLINFFKGRDSFQADNILVNFDDCAQDTVGSCPDKLYPLADIYNSTVKFIGTPNQRFLYSGYKLFKDQVKSSGTGNEKLVLVGSNSGMLHAVRVSNGSEAWGFIPPNLLSSLKNVRLGVNCVNGNCSTPDPRKTASQFFVDSTVKLMDVCNGNNCSTLADNWKTVAIVTFGEGGEGLMALDLTNHMNPVFMWAVLNETPHIYESPLYNNLAGCGTFKRVIYWGADGARQAYSEHIPAAQSGGDNPMVPARDLSNLSNTWSQPVLAQIGGTNSSVGTFVAILGAGGVENSRVVRDNNDPNLNLCTNNMNFGSSVYVLDLFSGVVLNRFDMPTGSNVTDIPARVPGLVSVLPKPNTASIDGLKNRIASRAYVGDLSGAVWRLDVSTIHSNIAITCNNSNSKCQKLVDVNSNSTKEDFIYKGVAIVYDGKTAEDDTALWVYFGTGDSSIYGMSNNTGSNHLVAVKDKNWDGTGNQATLSYSSLTNITNADPRTSGNSDCDPIDGWKFELPTGSSPEKAGKLVGKPVVIKGHIYYTVYFHGEDNDTSQCSGHLGKSYLYSFELFSGCYNQQFQNFSNGTKARAFLGVGVATAPVVRENKMFFGISGDDPDTDFERDENFIVWDMDKNKPNETTHRNSDLPFSYFRELY